jgi:vancomycin permeability regulator SanA
MNFIVLAIIFILVYMTYTRTRSLIYSAIALFAAVLIVPLAADQVTAWVSPSKLYSPTANSTTCSC